jgi:hypothetical protein
LTREGEVARANKDNTDAGPFSECPFSPFSYERTSDGALLAAVYARDPEITDPQYSIHYTSFFLRSEDEGNSWQYFSRLPSPSRFNYEEPTILAGPDGLVVCMIRVGWGHTPKEELPPEAENPHGRGGGTGTAMGWFFYQSLSYDHGLTWTEPEQTEIWGHPAYLLRLRSGTVLMVYGHRRPPWSVRSILSFDEGRTWDLETMMTIREFNPGGRDLGYPLATQLDDGSVLCAYYGYISENVEKVSPQGIYVSILKEG